MKEWSFFTKYDILLSKWTIVFCDRFSRLIGGCVLKMLIAVILGVLICPRTFAQQARVKPVSEGAVKRYVRVNNSKPQTLHCEIAEWYDHSTKSDIYDVDPVSIGGNGIYGTAKHFPQVRFQGYAEIDIYRQIIYSFAKVIETNAKVSAVSYGREEGSHIRPADVTLQLGDDGHVEVFCYVNAPK
jgi:hypothetical protein